MDKNNKAKQRYKTKEVNVLKLAEFYKKVKKTNKWQTKYTTNRGGE